MVGEPQPALKEGLAVVPFVMFWRVLQKILERWGFHRLGVAGVAIIVAIALVPSSWLRLGGFLRGPVRRFLGFG